MSNLGIRFVLPYVGVNGLKVTGNEIGLNPSGIGSLGALILNANGDNDSNSSILLIYSSYNNGGTSIFLVDNDTGKNLGYIDTGANIQFGLLPSEGTYNSVLQVEDVYLNPTLSDNEGSLVISNNDNNGGITQVRSFELTVQNLQFKIVQNGTVSIDSTRYIPLLIDGVIYKLLIAP